MGQGEVLKILEKTKKWMTSMEISKITGTAYSSTNTNLSKLFRDGYVYRKVNVKQAFTQPGYIYKAK